jgi:DNA topoisomerase I
METAGMAEQVTAPPPPEAAQEAGLRHVNDGRPGITRVRRGKGFAYRDSGGRIIRDEQVLRRIRSLVIPPAWEQVWICPDPLGHLQATGRDARGRKQYRYHPRWRKVRDQNKYDRMIAFANALPQIRRRIHQDMKKPGLPREKVLATVVRLLETTLIRVGNEEYARDNNSYGLTTMQDRHAEINGSSVHFEFRGKGGVRHEVDVQDRRLARIVSRCQDLPGQELFQYLDDEGKRQDIDSNDVNEYLREVTGQDFTAKDFRTWAGTVLAAEALREFESVDSEAAAKRNVVRAVESVATRLGNTSAVCRKCYIHPAILDGYMEGTLLQTLRRRAKKELDENLPRLSREEAAVLALLSRRLERKARPRRRRR